MNNKNAFTLIELLFVLMLISIIVFISVPIAHHVQKQLEIIQFFQVFDADVRYVQNQSLGEPKKIYIALFDNEYTVTEQTNVIYRREYPGDMYIRIPDHIQFNVRGTIINPTTIRFYSDGRTVYKAVFPLGKGRHYIEKQ